MVSSTAIGVPIPRVDGVDKVTGGARYAAEVTLPGALWARLLRSPLPHARIVRVDTSRAKAVGGVHAVLTGADVPGRRYGRRILDIPVLAEGVVRYVGEPVAAVAAEDEETAQSAAELIDVEYEELPALFDPFAAMEPGAILLHPDVVTYEGLPRPLEAPTNVFVRSRWGKGDVDAGFGQADEIVENTFTTAMMHQAYLEPDACLVWIDDAGRMQVWASTKNPHQAKPLLANAVGESKENVLLHPVAIGGDFGAKGMPRNAPICYFLAKATGRPVRSVMDYAEVLTTANPRHPAVIRMRTGVKRDGTLVAHDVQVVFDTGAYGGCIPGGFLPGTRGAGGPYRIPNVRIDAAHTYTNRVPCGYMRGPGRLQVAFALESQMDCVAKAIGLDPVELRRRNVIRDGDENAAGQSFVDVRGVETLEAAVRASGYYDPKPSGVGRGIALCQQEAGGGETHASVTLHADGSVAVGTPVFEQGSGTYTILQQVTAEALGLPPDRVRVEVLDTDAVPFDTGISADRGTRLGSQAAYAAAQAAKREACKLAAELLGWPEDALELRGELIVQQRPRDAEESISDRSPRLGVSAEEGSGERLPPLPTTDGWAEGIPWRELASRMGAPIVGWGHVDEEESSPVTGFAAQVAEVAVDAETGQVKLLRLTMALDTGRILNPQGHQGQINGGAVQGLGYGLIEEMRAYHGHLDTPSLAEYKMPSIADVPAMETVLLTSESGIGPLQVKSAGERTNTPAAPAIANAVADAAGARVYDLPITAERVYRALRRQ